MALTLAHGALALMGMFPHSDFISMALPLDPLRHFLQEKGIAAWPFRFCLNIVALSIWVGLLNGLLGLSFGVIRLLHLSQGLKIISLKPQEEQPWEQAQRWPLWRRGLGVIPLVTLIWACADGLCFTPFVACIWIAMSYLLWWPFWGAREA